VQNAIEFGYQVKTMSEQTNMEEGENMSSDMQEEDRPADHVKVFIVPVPVICRTPEEVTISVNLFEVHFCLSIHPIELEFPQVRKAAVNFGFPVQLKIKDGIEVSRTSNRPGLASVRIVEREDEALSVASVMIRNHGLLRAMQRNRKLTTMEREASTIQINIQKLEQHPVSDTAKIQRLKSALSQCQADIKMFKASGDSSTEVIVSHSSRAAHSIADYRGQPLWDPELQTAHMECDRAGAVIRAAYNGDMAILSQIGISKEMVDEHEGSAGLQTRPARIQQDMDVIKHLLDQMNQVQTDDPEHHQKAKEMQAEWDRLNLDHIVASTRFVCVCVCVCVCVLCG
jgi:hypothetical protein